MQIKIKVNERLELYGEVYKPHREAYPEVTSFEALIYVGDWPFGCDLIDVTDKLSHSARKEYEQEMIRRFEQATYDSQFDPVDPTDDDKWEQAFGEGGL